MKSGGYRNVLHLTDYGAPYEGNFVASLCSLERRLGENGHSMTYVFPPRALDCDWARRMHTERSNVFFTPEGGFFSYARFVRRLLIERDVDILHVHFIHYREKLAALLACRTCGHRVQTVCHLHNHLAVPRSLFRGLPQRFYLRAADLFLCCSRSVAEQLIADGARPGKVAVAENAIAFGRLDAYETLDRRAYGIGADAFVVLLFGFDFRRKGVDLAVEAVLSLRERGGPDITLAVVLSSRRQEVERAIQSLLGADSLPAWIVLLPPRGDVGTYYHFADVFISPSREEGFCYSLVEAAYCETPTVASAIDAQRDLALTPDSFCRPDDAQALANAIRLQLSERLSEGRAARLLEAKRRVVETYSLDAWSGAVCRAYDALYGR